MGRPKTRAEFVQRLKRIYDSFPDKDLTWDEFRNQMLELWDPKKVAEMRSEERMKDARGSGTITPGRRIIT